jgi:hypothetical protein
MSSSGAGFKHVAVKSISNSQNLWGHNKFAFYNASESASHFMARDHITKMAAGQCYPLELTMFVPGPFPNPPRPAARSESVSFNLSASGASVGGTFHTSRQCDLESQTSSFTIPANYVWKEIYFKPSSTAAGEYSLTGQLSGASTPAMTAQAFNFTLGPAAVSQYQIRSWQNIFTPDQCIEFSVAAANSVGADIHVQSDRELQVTASGGTVYRGSGCHEPMTDEAPAIIRRHRSQTDSLSFRAYPGVTQVILMAGDSNSIGSQETIFNLDAPVAFSLQSFKNDAYQPLSHSMRNFCHRIQVNALDIAGGPFVSQHPYSASLQIHGAEGSFYMDSRCQNPTPEIAFEPYSSFKEVYVKVSGVQSTYQAEVRYQNTSIATMQSVNHQDIARISALPLYQDGASYTHYVKAFDSQNNLIHPIDPINVRLIIPSQLNLLHRFLLADGITQVAEVSAALYVNASPQSPTTPVHLNGGLPADFVVDLEMLSPFYGPVDGVRTIIYPP